VGHSPSTSRLSISRRERGFDDVKVNLVSAGKTAYCEQGLLQTGCSTSAAVQVGAVDGDPATRQRGGGGRANVVPIRSGLIGF